MAPEVVLGLILRVREADSSVLAHFAQNGVRFRHPKRFQCVVFPWNKAFCMVWLLFASQTVVGCLALFDIGHLAHVIALVCLDRAFVLENRKDYVLVEGPIVRYAMSVEDLVAFLV